MSRDREIEEAAAKCIAIAVFYHNSRDTRHADEQLFVDDVRSVARWISAEEMGEQKAEHRILRPLHAELIARYGAEIGSSLHADFLSAFHAARRSERGKRLHQS